MIKKNCSKEQLKKPINTLSQWKRLCKQAFDEITATCENGTELELLLLIDEIKSEKTNNKSDLKRLKRAYNERFAV